jgi:hypothetical protein
MALFDTDDCHEILRVLGYTVPYTRIYLDNLAAQDFPDTVVDRVGAILTQIENIDKQIYASLPDTMAKEVGELVLNYRQHYAMLRGQARMLVQEISGLVGVCAQAQAFSKYGGVGGGAIALSYW